MQGGEGEGVLPVHRSLDNAVDAASCNFLLSHLNPAIGEFAQDSRRERRKGKTKY
ncbi:hypothetical protein DBT_1500 [Dissulfuribacter thermophilus]|uniref:Uncharacterized protein n=1 Tax=Dissulfuribacter thermophilus TaxID=1156395 RepID=A0A1B9F5B2_9BACT|nr:hypothetical protein [Dissulfuribacter thermophilus]OCC15014.1 hypothetical protein DBT_1500 [Dissulfuribacter thermophilus]